jgi:hypothetical protein
MNKKFILFIIALWGCTLCCFADVVTFREGNTLQGDVKMEQGQLKLYLQPIGHVILAPEQVRSIDYSFQLSSGDALPIYREIAETLREIPEFENLSAKVSSLKKTSGKVIPQPGESLQAEIDTFFLNHQPLFEQLVAASLMSRCDRKTFLSQQAPPEAILNPSHEIFQVLPRLEQLYQLFILSSDTMQNNALQKEKFPAGLRMTEHWKSSLPREATLALNSVGGTALEYARLSAANNTEEAWNRLQELLRSLSMEQTAVAAEDILQLKFQLYLSAFKDKGIKTPPPSDFQSSAGWISLLAARVRLDYRQNPQELSRENELAYRDLLIDLLAPDWTIQKHPDYQSVLTALELFRSQKEALIYRNAKILREGGYRENDVSYNPLKELPDSL